jgi:triphosphoribosyl-dephospho-CoA synthase
MRIFDVVKAAQMASLIEVSSYPKPGNVHRMADFEDLKYEEYLLCGAALGETIFRACHASKHDCYRMGGYIKKAVLESKKWSPHNANLGIILLFIPLAQAAARCSFSETREKLRTICKTTTVEDALETWDAIREASPSGMGQVERFDVTTQKGRDEILAQEKTLFDLFQYSEEWDRISYEWTHNFQITFEVGFPSLKNYFQESEDINHATRMTYLEILASFYDTLIARKVGKLKAEEISSKAKKLLYDFSEEKLWGFDRELRADRNLNPGTTADLTASSLFAFFLERLEKGF